MNMDPLRRAHGLLRELYSMKRVDDIEHRWWEVRYIENDVARNAIMNLHEELRSEDLQIMTTHDIVTFVKSHSDREDAFRFIERLMHLVAVFVQFHRGIMTWKTIDKSHADFMFNLMTWNGESPVPPTLHQPINLRGKKFLVVENNENTSEETLECQRLHEEYKALSLALRHHISNSTDLDVMNLPMFMSSCRPGSQDATRKFVPDIIKKVIGDRLDHLSSCVTYTYKDGQTRYVANELGTLCVVIVEGYLKLLSLEIMRL